MIYVSSTSNLISNIYVVATEPRILKFYDDVQVAQTWSIFTGPVTNYISIKFSSKICRFIANCSIQLANHNVVNASGYRMRHRSQLSYIFLAIAIYLPV